MLGVLDSYVSQLGIENNTAAVTPDQTPAQTQLTREDDPEAEVDFCISEEEASELAIVDDESLANPGNLPVENHKQLTLTTANRPPEGLPQASANLVKLHPARDMAGVEPAPELPAEHAGVQRPRALVVDDSPSVRKQIELELNLFHVDADYAQDMSEAVNLLAENRYDIAFLDVVLPDGDGFQICKNIKGESKEVIVIMLTGKASPADKIKGSMAGCDAYLVKPVGRMTFQNTVCKYLGLREQFEAVHG